MNSKLAFVFPGQGSQSVGMLAKLAHQFPIVEKTFHEASDHLGYDVWTLVQQDPHQQLNLTEFTQPALLAAGVACWRVWQEKEDVIPMLMAGHSLGEYTALVCASAMRFEDALKLVQLRGQLMQEAVPEGKGAMAAIVGLDVEQVQALCDAAAHGDVISPANFNAIGQIVIAGHSAAVDRAVELAKSHGAKLAKKLAVSVPSHCALMEPAAKELQRTLENIPVYEPKITVIHNVDLKVHQHADDIRDALVRQLFFPVRWVETIQLMYGDGVRTIIECGPGKVLAGLIKRIESDIVVNPIEEMEMN